MVINIIAKVDGKTFSGPVRADSIWNARAKFLRTYPDATIVFERVSIDPDATEAERALGL